MDAALNPISCRFLKVATLPKQLDNREYFYHFAATSALGEQQNETVEFSVSRNAKP
jgi:hypothetical protein